MELVANMASFRSTGMSVELSRYFHVWICIYWQIFMLPRSHFKLLISFAELSRLSHQTGQFSMTQNRVGYFVILLQCWHLPYSDPRELFSSLTLEDIISYRHAQHGEGFPWNSPCWESRHDSLWPKKSAIIWLIHNYHVHTFHVNLTWTLSKGYHKLLHCVMSK